MLYLYQSNDHWYYLTNEVNDYRNVPIGEKWDILVSVGEDIYQILERTPSNKILDVLFYLWTMGDVSEEDYIYLLKKHKDRIYESTKW
jgi:hypothetical protein